MFPQLGSLNLIFLHLSVTITRLVQTAHNFSTVLLLALIQFDDDLCTFPLIKIFITVACTMFGRISVLLVEAREAGSHTFRTNEWFLL
jgi:hypothetical protein